MRWLAMCAALVLLALPVRADVGIDWLAKAGRYAEHCRIHLNVADGRGLAGFELDYGSDDAATFQRWSRELARNATFAAFCTDAFVMLLGLQAWERERFGRTGLAFCFDGLRDNQAEMRRFAALVVENGQKPEWRERPFLDLAHAVLQHMYPCE